MCTTHVRGPGYDVVQQPEMRQVATKHHYRQRQPLQIVIGRDEG